MHQAHAGVEVAAGVAVEDARHRRRIGRRGEGQGLDKPAGLERHLEIVVRLCGGQEGVGGVGADRSEPVRRRFADGIVLVAKLADEVCDGGGVARIGRGTLARRSAQERDRDERPNGCHRSHA